MCGIDNSSVNMYSFLNMVFENFPLGYRNVKIFLTFAMFMLILSRESEALIQKKEDRSQYLANSMTIRYQL